MHGRNCSGFSTLASGRWHGKVYANFSHVGKKLRIHAGIHKGFAATQSMAPQGMTARLK
jgi:hypothetical protein